MGDSRKEYVDYKHIAERVRNLPTAYDINKVVAQFEQDKRERERRETIHSGYKRDTVDKRVRRG